MLVPSVAPVYNNICCNDDSYRTNIKQIIEYIAWVSPEVVCTVGSQKWIGNYRLVWLGIG